MDKSDVRTPAIERTACPLCGGERVDALYTLQHQGGDYIGSYASSIVQCVRCGFIFQNPQPTSEMLLRYYLHDQSSSGQISRDRSRGSAYWRLMESLAKMVGELNPRKGAKLLDVGSGSGTIVQMLREFYEVEAEGIDPAPKAVALARESGIPVSQYSLEDFSGQAKSGRYQIVTMFNVLEHLKNPRTLIARVRDLLAPGGHLVITVPDSRRPFLTLAEFFSYEHLSHFSSDTLANLLQAEGFRIDHWDAPPGTFPLLRFWATRVSKKKKLAAVQDQATAEVIRAYSRDKADLHERYVRQILPMMRHYKNQGRRIALYGAGAHSRYLFAHHDLSNLIDTVLESDQRKWGSRFGRLTVQSPSVLDTGDVDVCLISSYRFEEEIYRSLSPARDRGIKVLRLYGERGRQVSGELRAS